VAGWPEEPGLTPAPALLRRRHLLLHGHRAASPGAASLGAATRRAACDAPPAPRRLRRAACAAPLTPPAARGAASPGSASHRAPPRPREAVSLPRAALRL